MGRGQGGAYAVFVWLPRVCGTCSPANQPMSSFRHIPLGRAIPDRPHAVSVSLPTMADLIGYETKDPAVIRHVLIHEIGHHFGFSDADMERIEATG